MANSPLSTLDGGARYIEFDTTTSEAVNLGNAHDKTGGSFVLQLKPSGSLGASGGLTIKTRLSGSGLTGSDLQGWPCTGPNSDTAIAAGTKLTDAGIYYVVADKLDVFLEYTQDTGSLEVYASPVQA